MSAQVIDASLELIQWLKGPPLEVDSSTQQDKEKVIDEAPAKCRPDSVEDYLRRLGTFRVPLWFNRPLALSPIECARRGWVCVAFDAIVCEVCGASVRVEKAADGGWLVDGERTEAKHLAAAVARCHSVFCPWRSHEAAPAIPGRLSDKDLSDHVEARLRTLLELKHRPLLTQDFQAEPPLEVLARAGWDKAVGLSTGNAKDSQTSSTAPLSVEYLQCAFCLRVVSVQSFSHIGLPVLDADGEPAKKSARLSIFSCVKRGSGDSEESAVLPPMPGQWTPVPPGGCSTSKCSESALDPYARHHFYCPLYSLEDDELSPFSVRVARARSAELARAGSGKLALDADEKKDSADSNAAATSAVEQAEDLLRALDDLLPPS